MEDIKNIENSPSNQNKLTLKAEDLLKNIGEHCLLPKDEGRNYLLKYLENYLMLSEILSKKSGFSDFKKEIEYKKDLSKLEKSYAKLYIMRMEFCLFNLLCRSLSSTDSFDWLYKEKIKKTNDDEVLFKKEKTPTTFGSLSTPTFLPRNFSQPFSSFEKKIEEKSEILNEKKKLSKSGSGAVLILIEIFNIYAVREKLNYIYDQEDFIDNFQSKLVMELTPLIKDLQKKEEQNILPENLKSVFNIDKISKLDFFMNKLPEHFNTLKSIPMLLKHKGNLEKLVSIINLGENDNKKFFQSLLKLYNCLKKRESKIEEYNKYVAQLKIQFDEGIHKITQNIHDHFNKNPEILKRRIENLESLDSEDNEELKNFFNVEDCKQKLKINLNTDKYRSVKFDGVKNLNFLNQEKEKLGLKPSNTLMLNYESLKMLDNKTQEIKSLNNLNDSSEEEDLNAFFSPIKQSFEKDKSTQNKNSEEKQDSFLISTNEKDLKSVNFTENKSKASVLKNVKKPTIMVGLSPKKDVKLPHEQNIERKKTIIGVNPLEGINPKKVEISESNKINKSLSDSQLFDNNKFN